MKNKEKMEYLTYLVTEVNKELEGFFTDKLQTAWRTMTFRKVRLMMNRFFGREMQKLYREENEHEA